MSNNQTAKRQRDIRKEVAAGDANEFSKATKAMRAGAREFPSRHLISSYITGRGTSDHRRLRIIVPL
ncbi:MAG TPA: hypothetical protein VGV07_22680 [Devosia sp.]|jgi:hypothetical protein|uniref:hypothetical protein n=1 Tax=Devosia sp. TaxID=1871048 RepID=UPI002DDCD485|nr:hypothetical protein [Devosia sp.]HEV2518074.1 hypothetical protein [Devosia sp.]